MPYPVASTIRSGRPTVAAAGGGVLSASAIAALVSWWAMDEESGTRYDSHGSNDLTDVNTVGYVSGVQGNAASFNQAATEAFTVTASSGLEINTVDFSIVGWFDRDNTSNNCLISKCSDSHWEWAIHYELDAGGPQVSIGNGSNATYQYIQYGGAALGTGWNFLVAWHDVSAKTLYVQINNGTVYSGTYTLTPNIGTNNVFFARTASRHIYDGDLDEWAIFKNYILTEDERTALYNSGSGVTYATAVGA